MSDFHFMDEDEVPSDIKNNPDIQKSLRITRAIINVLDREFPKDLDDEKNKTNHDHLMAIIMSLISFVATIRVKSDFVPQFMLGLIRHMAELAPAYQKLGKDLEEAAGE